jgi:hypothetical protein
MEQQHKSWALYVFSSARVLRSYTIGQLVGLGISWVWMGLEGKGSQYRKLNQVDTYALVEELQSHGIRVLGSSIIGMEDHTPENIDQVIDHAIGHNSDFHQFMLYTPISGTPLYEAHKKNGTLLPESTFSVADTHGQYRFNFIHPHIGQNREEEFLISAFKKDFEVNGPSLARMIRTLLTGWQRYRNHPDARIRSRFAWEAAPLGTLYAGAVWAMKKRYRRNQRHFKNLAALLNDIYRELGWLPRMAAPLIGSCLYLTLKKEEIRLARGWTYEPQPICEKNPAALALEKTMGQNAARHGAGTFVPAPDFTCVRP